MAYYNSNKNILYEGFTQANFILLGDSILNKNTYVDDGKSVFELLQEKTSDKTECFTTDNAFISDVYSQISQMTESDNTANSVIFLSVGSTDILNQSDENNGQIDLNTIFTSYTKLVQTIQSTFPNPKLVLFDIFYPNNSKYEQYYETVQQWNNLLYNYVLKNNLNLFKLSSVLTSSQDITDISDDIQLTETGRQQLVNSMLQY
jgi:hypothetical protein